MIILLVSLAHNVKIYTLMDNIWKYAVYVFKFTHVLVKCFIVKNVIDAYSGKEKIFCTVINVMNVQRN